MNDLILKTPQEEIAQINKKLMDENPIVELKKIQVNEYNMYQGWELVRLVQLKETMGMSYQEPNPCFGQNINGYTNSNPTISTIRPTEREDIYAIIGRREHALCIDLSNQIKESIKRNHDLSLENSNVKKTFEETDKQFSDSKERMIRDRNEYDRKIKDLELKCTENVTQKNKYEVDMNKLRKQFGEMAINKALDGGV